MLLSDVVFISEGDSWWVPVYEMKGHHNKINASKEDDRRSATAWLCGSHTKFLYAFRLSCHSVSDGGCISRKTTGICRRGMLNSLIFSEQKLNNHSQEQALRSIALYIRCRGWKKAPSRVLFSCRRAVGSHEPRNRTSVPSCFSHEHLLLHCSEIFISWFLTLGSWNVLVL